MLFNFDFIAPIIEATKLFGWQGTLSGIIAVGVVYGIVSALIKLRGLKFVERLFPAVVVGPVIMIIGLSLASIAVDMAKADWILAVIALLTAVLVVILGKGMLKLIPIFIAVGMGYIVAVVWGKVDYTAIKEASWFSWPAFTTPRFSWQNFLAGCPTPPIRKLQKQFRSPK